MKKIFSTTLIAILSLFLYVPNMALAEDKQWVELNETYSVQQTAKAYNDRVLEDVQVYIPLQRDTDPNPYVRRYSGMNSQGWWIGIDQNEPGYICQIEAIIPDSTDILALRTVSDVLLTIAAGESSEYLNINNRNKRDVLHNLYQAAYNGLHYGTGIYYCPDTNRYYQLDVSHSLPDSCWFYTVRAYAN